MSSREVCMSSVPEIAIEWAIQFACNTNVDLAALSSVNRSWRNLTCKVLQNMLQLAWDSVSSSSVYYDVNQLQNTEFEYDTSGKNNLSEGKCNPFLHRYFHISRLLLPEMALEIMRRKILKYDEETLGKNDAYYRSALQLVNRTPRSLLHAQSDASTFCLAWFHPMGIQIQTVKLGSGSGSGSGFDGDNYDEYDDDEPDDDNTVLQTCSSEWRGHRNAMDVLIPFGYSTSFVRAILSIAVDISSSSPKDINNQKKYKSIAYDYKRSTEPPTYGEGAIKSHHTSFAVRGATLARPDGYCLCWDKKEESYNQCPNSQKESETVLSIKSDRVSNRDDTDENRRRMQHYKYHKLRKLRKLRQHKRRERMREYLPRMVMSTKSKNPYYQGKDGEVGVEEIISQYCHQGDSQHYLIHNQSDDQQEHQKIVTINKGRRQRCLQFLNADGSRAVCLRTPPFDCGPVTAPVTMFCVGIATEDGCFASGLKHRFEFGHIHPVNERDELIDMSPICIATSGGGGFDIGQGNANIGAGISETKHSDLVDSRSCGLNYQQASPSLSSSFENCTDSSDDEMERQGEIICCCKFQMNVSNISHCDYHSHQNNDCCGHDLEGKCNCYAQEEVEVDENNITRGKLGPGYWHCYSAIFDGENSIIRVDGVTEPCDNNSSSAGNGSNNDVKIYEEKEKIQNKPNNFLTNLNNSSGPVLDGLTIGADHCFHMSLCFGEGSEGEGEGSIAEFIVFKGRMELADLICMEQYLMKRHGIIDGASMIKLQHPAKPDLAPLHENENVDIISGTKGEVSSVFCHNHQQEYQHVNLVPKDANSHISQRRRTSIGNHWQEDEWRRQAHALMIQGPPYHLSSNSTSNRGVPLRVAAKHRYVSWARSSDVTGKYIPVSRIGSKLSTGSSDW